MATADKIFLLPVLVKVVNDMKSAGKKIVFTNGCFDILHLGHIDYLEKARSLGDYLIVGLNSDLSVSKLKGNNRPVLNELTRSRILAAMEFVDALVIFQEDTPYNLINMLKPDILVKGKDYTEENIVGSNIVKSYGGKVVTIELVKGFSTTEIINKIKNL